MFENLNKQEKLILDLLAKEEISGNKEFQSVLNTYDVNHKIAIALTQKGYINAKINVGQNGYKELQFDYGINGYFLSDLALECYNIKK